MEVTERGRTFSRKLGVRDRRPVGRASVGETRGRDQLAVQVMYDSSGRCSHAAFPDGTAVLVSLGVGLRHLADLC